MLKIFKLVPKTKLNKHIREFESLPNIKAEIYALIIILGFSMIVGNISGLFLGSSMTDQDGFAELGQHFANNNNFNGTLSRAPIYPLFLGIIIKLFGYSNYVFIFVQSILLGCVGYLSFFICNKFSNLKTASLFVGLLVVIYPMNFLYVSKILVEITFAFLVLLMIWYAYLSLEKPSTKNMILFGVFTGVSALCKSVTLLFPIFLASSIFLLRLINVELFKKYSVSNLIKLFVIPFLFLLITISPWTIRNFNNTGEFILISKGVGYEFLRGKYMTQENAYYNLKKTNTEIWDKFDVEYNEILKSINIQTKAQENEVLDKMMKDFILDNPWQYIVRTAKQIPMFWYRGGTLAKSLLFLFLAIPVLVMFIIAFFKQRKISRFNWVVLIAVIYFNLLYASILSIARYSMPLYPLMIIVGAYGVIESFQKRKTKLEI